MTCILQYRRLQWETTNRQLHRTDDIGPPENTKNTKYNGVRSESLYIIVVYIIQCRCRGAESFGASGITIFFLLYFILFFYSNSNFDCYVRASATRIESFPPPRAGLDVKNIIIITRHVYNIQVYYISPNAQKSIMNRFRKGLKKQFN